MKFISVSLALVALPAISAASEVPQQHRRMFSDGNISPRDWSLLWAVSSYQDTLDFCTNFRSVCITVVGNLGFHHSLDCVVEQPGPAIEAFCGGVRKKADGSFGNGTDFDFTSIICPNMQGCNIVSSPSAPAPAYYPGAGANATSSPAPVPVTSATSSSATSSAVVYSTVATISQIAAASPISAATVTYSTLTVSASLALLSMPSSTISSAATTSVPSISTVAVTTSPTPTPLTAAMASTVSVVQAAASTPKIGATNSTSGSSNHLPLLSVLIGAGLAIIAV